MFASDLDDLDTTALLAAAAEYAHDQEHAAVGILCTALAFADRNAVVKWIDGEPLPGYEKIKVYGGEGCPGIAEFAPVEFGAVIGLSSGAAAALIGEALALRHRLPRVWAAVLAGNALAWRARKIAHACLALSVQAAAIVDRRVAGIVNTLTPGKLARIVTAALWQADPERAQAHAEATARERGVFVTQSEPDDDHGTKRIWVRAATGDVIRFDATINDLAQALKTLGDTDPLNQRRAKAIGWIADPAAAHNLLQVARHLARTQPTQPASPRHPNQPTPQPPANPEAALDPEDPDELVAPQDPADLDNPAPTSHPDPGKPADPGDPADPEDAVRATDQANLVDLGDLDDSGDLPDVLGLPDLSDREYPADPKDPADPDDLDYLGYLGNSADWGDAANPEDAAALPGAGCDGAGAGPDAGVLAGGDAGGDAVGLSGEVSGEVSGEDAFTRLALAGTLPGRLAAIKRDAHSNGLGAGTGKRGQHTLYVHLTDTTLATGTGVLRVEDLGPHLAGQLQELLGHDQVVVKPVIDLHDQISVHSYEIPDRIRERVRLRHPVDMFPYGTTEATQRMDQDHITPYDRTGPPGQTNTDNLIPQGRLHHRAKTFGGWHNRRLPTGAIEWTSPHGYQFHVDHTGTHRVPHHPTDTHRQHPPNR